VIGDGAMTGGVAFEAIHQAGGLGTPIVVVLNDNGMSIAPNVGALSRYFNRVRLNPRLWHAREGVEGGLTKLPVGIGSAFERLGPQLKESIKAFWAPGLFWEELDWAYTGVIDGHDIRGAARRAARGARRAATGRRAHRDGQGQGLRAGRNRRPRGDGALARRQAAVDQQRRGDGGVKVSAPPRPPQYTTVFGEALLEECRRDERVIGITAAMNSGTGLNILQQAMPERYFDVGIAEQQACFSPPDSRSRVRGRSPRSIRPSSSAPTTRSSTTSACSGCRSCSRWIAPGWSAMTGRRTTACSTSPTCAACRTSC
jgi:1-deoxy-D-xylulose-5-phosphate synthase